METTIELMGVKYTALLVVMYSLSLCNDKAIVIETTKVIETGG